DLSGNGNHLVQPTSGAAPSYGTRQVNGIDVVDANGTSQWARINAEIGGSGVLHVFAVFVIDTAITGRYLFEAGAISDGRDGWYLRQDTSAKLQLTIEDDVTSGRDFRLSPIAFTAGVPFLVEVKIDTDQLISLAINGIETSSPTPTKGGFANPENTLDF